MAASGTYTRKRKETQVGRQCLPIIKRSTPEERCGRAPSPEPRAQSPASRVLICYSASLCQDTGRGLRMEPKQVKAELMTSMKLWAGWGTIS